MITSLMVSTEIITFLLTRLVFKIVCHDGRAYLMQASSHQDMIRWMSFRADSAPVNSGLSRPIVQLSKDSSPIHRRAISPSEKNTSPTMLPSRPEKVKGKVSFFNGKKFGLRRDPKPPLPPRVPNKMPAFLSSTSADRSSKYMILVSLY